MAVLLKSLYQQHSNERRSLGGQIATAGTGIKPDKSPALANE
jgi:hypothetical protein